MSKPLPILTHMPAHIKQEIAEYATTVTKFSLRQCSKEFKSIIANSKIHFDSLLLRDFNHQNQHLRLAAIFQKDHAIDLDFYPRDLDGYTVKNISQNSGKVVETGNFIDAALMKLLKLFRRFPKICVRRFEVNVQSWCKHNDEQDQRILDSLEACLMSLHSVLCVKDLVMKTGRNQRDIFRVLRFLTPGTLESITLGARKCYSHRLIADIVLDDVAETIQWKHAKHLKVEGYYHRLREEDILHFESVSCETRKLTTDMISEIVQNFIRHSHWKKRIFVCGTYGRRAALHQYLSQFKRERCGNNIENVYTVSEGCKLRIRMPLDIENTIIITREE